MNLTTIRRAFIKALGIKPRDTRQFAGKASYPRRKANRPVMTGDKTSEIKATKKGAVHWDGSRSRSR